ncbi:uncharacterized protein LOC142337894 isoform X3 [Convolutriloba macropyga]|uniref:uncharacterized protein LOC142337894 isoform X3 n=1 Tax=Convolutriloba macropyga TaxID=536237 RepID=UPI003F529016
MNSGLVQSKQALQQLFNGTTVPLSALPNGNMDKTNRRSTNTPTVPVSPTSSSAVFVVNEVVDGGNGKEQDAISAVPIGGIHAAYPSHADLESTSFSTFSADRIVKSGEAAKSNHTTTQNSSGKRPKSLSGDGRSKSPLHSDIHSLHNLNSSYSAGGANSKLPNPRKYDPKYNPKSRKSKEPKTDENSNRTRSFVVKPFEASIEIANAFQSELERLYTESAADENFLVDKSSTEIRLEDVVLETESADDVLGTARLKKNVVARFENVREGPVENGDDVRVIASCDGTNNQRSKSVVVSDHIVVVDDDDDGFDDDLETEKMESTDTESVPPPPSDELPSDDCESKPEDIIEAVKQNKPLESQPPDLDTTTAPKKISMDKAASLSCLEINSINTWEETAESGKSSEGKESVVLREKRDERKSSRPMSCYTPSLPTLEPQHAASKSDDLESNKDISKSPTASILRNSNTYQSSINQHYRNSLPYHTSIQHQNAPSASFLDRLIKPGRKLSSATSLSHLPLADDSSAKQHKSFSFSRTFGRSKKRKAHKWHLVDSNDVGSAFEFAFDATGGPRSGQGSGPMGSSDLVPCCTTCNRPLEEPNDGQLSISSIAICIHCGVVVHDEETCRGTAENEDCIPKSKKTSIPAAGAKRRLGVRNSYSGGNSGSFGQSARYSAKSLTSLNTAGVASSTGLNSGGVGGAGGVFQSGSLSSADYIHMHNGSIIEEDEKDSASPLFNSEQYFPSNSTLDNTQLNESLDPYMITSQQHQPAFHSRQSSAGSGGGGSHQGSFKHGRSTSLLTPGSSMSSQNSTVVRGDSDHSPSSSLLSTTSSGVTLRPNTSGGTLPRRTDPNSSSRMGRATGSGVAPRPYSTGSGSVFLNNVQRTKSTPDLSGSGPQEKVRQSLESINDDVDTSTSVLNRFSLDPRLATEGEFPDLSEQRWDKTVPEKLLKSLPRYTIQEQSAIHEFLLTELNFLNDLYLVEDIYIFNIMNTLDWKQWSVSRQFGDTAAVEISTKLFGSDEIRTTLRSLSLRLVRSLNEQRKLARNPESEDGEPDYIMHVARILENHFCDEENMDHYINAFHRIIIGQDVAKKFYDDARENMADFKKFISDCSKIPALKRRTLIETRASIIQRPHKYPALFSGLIKHAQKEADTEKTESAQEKLECLRNCQRAIDNILTQLDRLLKEHQMAELLRDIWRRTDSKPVTVDVKDEQDRKSERKMTFDKADLESSGLRLQKTFSVKLTVNTEVKEKVKNVLILVMEDSLVLLEVKDQNAPQYALLNVPRLMPVLSSDKMMLSAGETLTDEQVHLIDKKYPSLSKITLKSRTERDEFFKICNSITSQSATPASSNDNSLLVSGFGMPKNHSFKKSSSSAASISTQSPQRSNSSKTSSQHQSHSSNPIGQPIASSSFGKYDSAKKEKEQLASNETLSVPGRAVHGKTFTTHSGNSSVESLNDSFTAHGHQDRRGSGVVTRRNRTTSTGLSGGAEEPTTHFASESVVSVKRRSLGAKVEACYDQLNQLLSEIITNQSLEEGETIKGNISSLMSELSDLKKSTTTVPNSQLSSINENNSSSASNTASSPVIRSESCKPNLEASGTESELAAVAGDNAGSKRPFSFTPADSNFKQQQQQSSGSRRSSMTGSVIFEIPQKRSVSCSCGGEATQYISELEAAIVAKNNHLMAAKDHITKLEEELKSKKDELMRSKKDTLQMQLDSLIKDNKTVGEFKRVQQNLNKSTSSSSAPAETSGSGPDATSTSHNTLDCSCGCEGEQNMCFFHLQKYSQKRGSIPNAADGPQESDESDMKGASGIGTSLLVVGGDSSETSPSSFLKSPLPQNTSLSPSDNLKNPDSASLAIKASQMPYGGTVASPPVDTVLPAVMTSSPHINSSNFVYPASAAAAVASSGSVGANQGAIAAQTTTAGLKRTQPVQQKKSVPSSSQEMKQQLPSKLMMSSTPGGPGSEATSSNKKIQQSVFASKKQSVPQSGLRQGTSNSSNQQPEPQNSKDNLYSRRRGTPTPRVEVTANSPVGSSEMTSSRRTTMTGNAFPHTTTNNSAKNPPQYFPETTHQPIIRSPSSGSSDNRFFKPEEEKLMTRSGQSVQMRKSSVKNSVFTSRNHRKSLEEKNNNVEPDSTTGDGTNPKEGEIFLL